MPGQKSDPVFDGLENSIRGIAIQRISGETMIAQGISNVNKETLIKQGFSANNRITIGILELDHIWYTALAYTRG